MEVFLTVAGTIAGALIGWGISHAYYKKSAGDFDQIVKQFQSVSDENMKRLLVSAVQVLEARGQLDIVHAKDGSITYRYRAGGPSLSISGSADYSAKPNEGGFSITGN